MSVGKGLLGAAAALAAAIGLQPGARAQTPGSASPHRIAAVTAGDLRTWDDQVTRLSRGGELVRRRLDADTLLPGRTHERFAQVYRGVPVYGGDIARQTDGGNTVSIFGTFYEGIDLDAAPGLSVEQATDVIARLSGVRLGASRRPTLIIYPHDGSFTLAYQAKAFRANGGTEYFIDATTGAVLNRLDAVQRQSAIGSGTGVLGDAKKVSAARVGGMYEADDRLRPPALFTFNMRGDLARTIDIFNNVIDPDESDLATDTDNAWTDAAVVDAHAYAGYVYDYYFKRFNRRGLDDRNLSLWSFVHPADRNTVLEQPIEIRNEYFVNAGYYGNGVMLYGEGLPPDVLRNGQQWNYLAGGLDIVGHELTHGVTDYTSRLIYENESGALNESFSDMMGTAVEFFFQTAGVGPLKADYLGGEDVVTPGGIRSLENPALHGQPDHYSRRVILPNDENNDNGGVHINSGIGNQAYYLAIEGGVNRTSGLSVTGVGQANREQIEKVMYRAFTQLMPANATYAVARAATVQAARDLYGAGSAAERAVLQAWTAVGVN